MNEREREREKERKFDNRVRKKYLKILITSSWRGCAEDELKKKKRERERVGKIGSIRNSLCRMTLDDIKLRRKNWES